MVETYLYGDSGVLSMAEMEENTPVWAVSVAPHAPDGVERGHEPGVQGKGRAFNGPIGVS